MEITETEINIGLQIWAVVGPLIAAGASAMWARRNQIQDRDYENNKDIRKEELEKEKYALDEIRERNKSHYEEVKQGLIEFMSSSHEYVMKKNKCYDDPSQENKKNEVEVYDKFIRSQQIVILLGDENLSNKAIDFWNAAVTVANAPRKDGITDEFTNKADEYRNTRHEFNEAAKTFLSSLHHPIQKKSEEK